MFGKKNKAKDYEITIIDFDGGIEKYIDVFGDQNCFYIPIKLYRRSADSLIQVKMEGLTPEISVIEKMINRVPGPIRNMIIDTIKTATNSDHIIIWVAAQRTSSKDAVRLSINNLDIIIS